MQRRRFLSLGATGLSAAAAASFAPAVLAQSPRELTRLKFTLDFRISGQVAPFFVAQAKGYYRDEGLEPSFDVGSGSVAAITRVASGAYDLGFGDLSALMEFQAQQGPLVQAVYQYYNRAPFAIIGRRDRGLSDFRSLQGKRIAAAAVESTRRAWPIAARHAGVKADAFEWVTTDFSQRDNVIVRGDVDGATYFHDSALSLFQRIDPAQLAVLSFADTGASLYGNGILAASELAAKKPEVVKAFLRATNRGLQETLANPAAAMAAVKQREPMVDEKLEAQRFALTAKYVVTADTRAHGLGAVRPELLRRQVEEVTQVFGLARTPSPEAVFNPAFLPAAAERAVKA
ncbi:ABC transporter substrate-binding protein [Piscinibacter sakaiensis]|uniref:Hydroxymethylpyrimidine ABC transporter, substrate-binding component n=1 Tax=Piscinibacter sakaiensis TaxID=1547922 RepID=A0A0K8NU22_PISS1|nr:ABC transporter substrate-binding protein [Piscinibacter sakaiensis]GAP33887.1 hydroxymethylpyrimidine ABC transporter, substrate-binding component [Piscinibacter sakaiensis]